MQKVLTEEVLTGVADKIFDLLMASAKDLEATYSRQGKFKVSLSFGMNETGKVTVDIKSKLDELSDRAEWYPKQGVLDGTKV